MRFLNPIYVRSFILVHWLVFAVCVLTVDAEKQEEKNYLLSLDEEEEETTRVVTIALSNKWRHAL